VTGDSRFHAILGAGPSYIVHPSDTAPALVALGAQIKIAGPAGEKTIPLEKFFVLPSVDYKRENILTPGEIVTEIIVPPPKAGSKGCYHKVRERLAWDHAIVAVATVVEKQRRCRNARVVMGGVAPIPWRAAKAEDFLRGKKLDEGTARQARGDSSRGRETTQRQRLQGEDCPRFDPTRFIGIGVNSRTVLLPHGQELLDCDLTRLSPKPL